MDDLPENMRVIIDDNAPIDEPADLPPPIGEPQQKFEPIASRDELLVSAWLKRKLPPRDYLLGELLSTTSRWLLVGETGVGKTIFAMSMGAAIAAGADFLGWQGRRRARVMYLDGELPAETFKERIEMIAGRYGSDIEFYGYNRDVLALDDMPPLNTPAGRAWLWREIDAIRPDIVFLDAIMCLLAGNMSEEESWAPVKDLVRQISSRRIAQIWLHHTGHDATKGCGTKTREWEMEAVAMLSKRGNDDGNSESAAFQLEFKKARLKTPKNFRQFSPKIIRLGDCGFTFSEGEATKGKPANELAIVRQAFVETYNRLADDTAETEGFDNAPVRKVRADAIREELKRRGFLEKDEKGRLTSTSKSHFRRAKTELLAKGGFVEADELVWHAK